ncbi:hypothetical protein [Actinomycetospora straminea]|uniref:Secreted protein with PEP-CTERM sorting signal n=1 Tax=Actinomycetospora straminea TaxID=663607 RepID=A0ABP9ELR5_9PSEU|nr:hypothetical protein [Actinomycetospora straminea]MDD7933311.1 hypothetical protein [Actinomycetospora straminea]
MTQWLFVLDATGALAKVAPGPPLTLAAAAVGFWAFRRSTRRLIRA